MTPNSASLPEFVSPDLLRQYTLACGKPEANSAEFEWPGPEEISRKHFQVESTMTRTAIAPPLKRGSFILLHEAPGGSGSAHLKLHLYQARFQRAREC